jgi:hypothetical protein
VTLLDEMRVQLAPGAAVGASALLIAFAAEIMGLAAIAVFTAPLLVTQVALRRYAGIRATYLQTVRALSRVTEIGGYVEAGHSVRVSRLAVAIGRELGMSEPALLELEYAALMHDIGQLSLRDPIPGGATVLVVKEEQRRIAEYGAEVIQQARVLDTVADIVRRQSDPCRPGERGQEPPLSSRIIRAANAFDDLVGSSVEPSRAAAAVERLRLDTASEYDPKVVEALSRLINRRSVLSPLSRDREPCRLTCRVRLSIDRQPRRDRTPGDPHRAPDGCQGHSGLLRRRRGPAVRPRGRRGRVHRACSALPELP